MGPGPMQVSVQAQCPIYIALLALDISGIGKGTFKNFEGRHSKSVGLPKSGAGAGVLLT